MISVEVLLRGGLDQLGHGHPLQLGDVDVAILGIVAGDRGADAADALGGFVELFGQRERFFALELGQQFAVDRGVDAAFAEVAARSVAVAGIAGIAALARVAAVHGAWAVTPCITVTGV